MTVIKSVSQLRAGDMVWKRHNEGVKYVVRKTCTSTTRHHDQPCAIIKSPNGHSHHFGRYYTNTGEWLCDRSPCMFERDT